MSSTPTDVTLVVPTIGRASLARLIASLNASRGPVPRAVVVVDDRPEPDATLALPAAIAGTSVTMAVSGGRGPAAARNVGIRRSTSSWIAFLDDDVEVSRDWLEHLADDLRTAETASAAASQGRIEVPLPTHRRATDWERDVGGLAGAAYVTADLAYRRDVLLAVGGFDEGFRYAYREDADLALRVREAGHTIVQGCRTTRHPPGPADTWI